MSIRIRLSIRIRSSIRFRLSIRLRFRPRPHGPTALVSVPIRNPAVAYVSPMYATEEIAGMTLYARRTFNLQLVEEGWAAPFVLYPSLPKVADLTLFRRAAQLARTEKRGHYRDAKTLTGYEFRFCVKLLRKEAQLPERSCADLETGKLYRPEQYLAVKSENRTFVWPADLKRAKEALGLVDANE